jgi:metal-sulfur cluster biosynthetic enzyme
MGSALHIPLTLTRAKEIVSVKITYGTTEKCPALMWLEKEYVDYISALDRRTAAHR